MSVNEQIMTESETTESEVNKSAIIKKALQTKGIDAKPVDIVEYIKTEHNVVVSAAYVSAIKSNICRKTSSTTLSFEAILLARKLVKETGSILGAKNALDSLVEEQERNSSLRELYDKQVNDIDARLVNKQRPLDQLDRRELTNEKRRIQQILKAMEGV